MRCGAWVTTLVASVATGCASGTSTQGAAATPTATSLVGSEWTLTDLGGTPALSSPGAQATLSFFEAGKVSGRGSCNRFTGPVEIGEVGVVKFGPLASTKMACMDEAVNAQETKYLAALQDAERVALEGDTLVIYSKGLSKPLRFSRTNK